MFKVGDIVKWKLCPDGIPDAQSLSIGNPKNGGRGIMQVNRQQMLKVVKVISYKTGGIKYFHYHVNTIGGTKIMMEDGGNRAELREEHLEYASITAVAKMRMKDA